MSDIRHHDSGLQLERTELAWRRTTLSLLVGSLVALRILPIYTGNAAWASVGLVGLICASLVWILARRRSRRAHRALATASSGTAPSESDATLPGAELLFATAVGVFALAALAIVVMVIGARG